MKAVTQGHLKAGINSVRTAKLRSFWTMLGVIIGVTSVITVVAIGEGIKQQISGQIHHMGKDLITVRPAQLNGHNGSSKNGASLLSGLNVSGSLSERDVVVVSQTKGVTASAPLTIITGSVQSEGVNYNKGFVIGTSEDLPSLLNQSVEFGAFLSYNDAGNNVAVIGQQVADDLFQEDVPLGRTLEFQGQKFIVRGVFNKFSATPLSQHADFNNAIFIPNDVAEGLSKNTAPTYEILAKASNGQTASVASSIESNLKKSHGGQNNFSVLQGNQSLASSDEILDLLTRLIAGVAAISLLVGGIGIMNVMLVSVAERMHEIGIRKAVGATNGQILSQFMIEATVLSLTGGIVGIVLSYVINLMLRLTTDLKPIISWEVVIVATGVSLLVGIIFGSLPALKAARKDPIDALRSE